MSLADRLWRKVNSNAADFNAWVGLLDAAEKQPNIDVTRKAFDAFLIHFPYCYGYWKKYANAERHLGNKDRCLKIFAMGVEAIPLSIDLWVAYLDANLEIIHGQDDYEIRMRNLYEIALEKAGLEFRSDPLWEHYISWESGHNRLGRVLAIYDRLLRTPTQLYFQNWDSFKKMIEENRPEDFLPLGEFAELLARVSPVAGTAMRIALSDSNKASIPIPDITDTDRNAIRKLVIDRREKIYQATYLQIMKRWYFEEKIRRPYFHVKPLEEAQLNNWAEYLSFEESEAASAEALLAVSATDDSQITPADVQLAKKRVRVLYERCLVACALYEHMWIRYAKYLEFTEQDIRSAREVWRRACGVHLRAKPTIHWHWALFEARHPAELDETGDDGKAIVKSITPLEILTQLEERLIDSALVCARRADAMRREGKPLLDLIICLRSGINRLRVRATEQTSLAHTVTGATASFSAAIALATAAQARAGASYLASKLARLLHRNVGNLIPPEGLPVWQLLLKSSYKPSPDVPNDTSDSNCVKTEEEAEIVPSVVVMEEKFIIETADAVTDVATNTKEEEQQNEEEEEMEVEDVEPSEVTPESLDVASAKTDIGDASVGSDSPPVVIGRKKNTSAAGAFKPIEGGKGMLEGAEVVVAVAPSESGGVVGEGEDEVEEPQAKRKRRSRWGDVEGETDRDLANLRAAEAAAEAERLARADRDQRAYASERAAITNVCPPSDLSTLPEEQRRLISPEDAALAVLRDAIDFDPRNERLYAQLLDIAYQRRPLDVDGFVEFANLAIVDSILPATVKLAFAQRKLQFLEEFCSDVNKISAAFDEYIQLAQLVVQCTNTGTRDAGDEMKKQQQQQQQSVGVDAAMAYTTPDLLNVTLPAPLRPSARRNPVTNGPVRRMPQMDIGAAILADAAAVGTPLPPPSSADTAAAIRFTAGAYEPLAGASSGCLPPPAPTMVPIAAGALPGTDAVEVWRGLEPTSYAAAVASSYASGGGTFYAPMSASADATASVQAPPPALMTREGV
ncbi:pre mRNA processing factor 39 [Echinococcus multilocularis]|uniref:Pre mRNA processing factor 39 n=1 Tax=Echinococcus multilocularis TaxID=6211 RepID=A0A068XWA5_ECHMU|nr:pre mRNA processing factor 39 [Echinococcus multilocularis]